MLITINTDGSYLPIHNCGGYAFWISCNGGRHLKWGSLNDCRGSIQAELMTIANSLHYIRTKKEFKNKKITKIIINCDLAHVFRYVDLEKPPRSVKRSLKLQELARFIVDKIGDTPIEYRHVKGHSRTKGQDKRSYVNKWCDVHARKGAKACVNKKT